MPKLPNVYVDCTKSRKLDTTKFKKFVKVVLVRNIKKKCCLLDDSWPAHKDKSMYKIPEKEVRTVILSEGSASLIQSLNVGFFRYWKDFLKQLTEMVILQKLPVNLS